MFPSEWNLNAWLIICSLEGLEGLEGVLVAIVMFAWISPKENGTENVFTSVTFFF